MKKIAMLNCLKANEVCTGAACLKAFHERTRSFAAYEGEDVELMAFMRCNGCDADVDTNKGLREKLDRLESIGVEIVHIGVCTKRRDGTECPTITALIAELEKRHIAVVRGTH